MTSNEDALSKGLPDKNSNDRRGSGYAEGDASHENVSTDNGYLSKLHQVLREFEVWVASNAERQKKSASASVEIIPSIFAREVLEGAPSRLLVGRSIADLVDILGEIWTTLTLFAQVKDQEATSFLIRQTAHNHRTRAGGDPIHTGPQYSAFTLAFLDRPFIVATLAEALRANDLTIHLLLHPIILIGDQKVSVAYVELEGSSVTFPPSALEELKESIVDLQRITDDFSAMLLRVDLAASFCERVPYRPETRHDSIRERGQLLRWLLDESFIFLGTCSWNSDQSDQFPWPHHGRLGAFSLAVERSSEDKVEGASSSEDGSIASTSAVVTGFGPTLFRQVEEDIRSFLTSPVDISITKLNSRSRVLRRQLLTHIAIKIPNENGTSYSIFSIVGLFSSKGLRGDCRVIPLIRVKLRDLIEDERIYENSYDYIYLVETLNRMPKEFSLRLPADPLREIVHAGIRMFHRSEIAVTAHFEPMGRGMSLAVLLSSDSFNNEMQEQVQSYLEDFFRIPRGSAEFHLDFSSQPQTRLYYYLPFPLDPEAAQYAQSIDPHLLERGLTEITQTWEDNLRIARQELSPNIPELIFPPEYQATHQPSHAIDIVHAAAKLSEAVPLTVISKNYDNQPTIVILHRAAEVRLSRSIPILENLGLEVISSSTYALKCTDSSPLFLHHLLVQPRLEAIMVRSDELAEVLEKSTVIHGLNQLFLGFEENDTLNSLLFTGSLSIEAIGLLRAYTALLWQVNKFATRRSIKDALALSPDAAILLWKLFTIRFNPLLTSVAGDSAPIPLEERTEEFGALSRQFYELLREVRDITQDRILRALHTLVSGTVRTNFFCNPKALALKLRSEDIAIIPLPRPKFEIFVYGPKVEGVHLRTDKVARGGIRWSERTDDYRTEVLGLMKTQKVKNVLIIPAGAKGGFVVRALPKDPQEVPAAVESCYQDFIRALLSITDNRQGAAVIHPEAVVRYDEPDPYFVVAADKGTATFSDCANKIAVEEFSFWLGDAFASGGSNGYDHKKYGITARGAWECVKRHFNDLTINHESDSFSVVGIGDMSGDVFGNGLLLSKNSRLIAAFNHKHIFIDPRPDLALAYAERARLFSLPRSQWTDYKREIIGQGGGVFDRIDKAIFITESIRTLLDIPQSAPSAMNGEELISYILKAPCDLLWNGGIGTYVKASTESHAEVNDGTNDALRINASELRARVVGEGGNLGFTQKARIEFSLGGGRINTDAIDNSAGVDLSDHEVNLKILFQHLLLEGSITESERLERLISIAPDVVEQVLWHNRSHATLLSIAVARAEFTTSYFHSLLRDLTRQGYINRRLDVLPEDDELSTRITNGKGLTRPELAVILAAVKMGIKEILIDSETLQDPLLEHYLFGYFPPLIREQYPHAIRQHPLAPNIIATQIANILVDAVGISFIHRMCVHHGVTSLVVIKCALAAETLLSAYEVREAVRQLDSPHLNAQYLQLRRELSEGLRDATHWLLSMHGSHLTIRGMVELYKGSYEEFVASPKEILGGDYLKEYEKRRESPLLTLLPPQVAARTHVFSFSLRALEVMWCAQKAHAPLKIMNAMRETTEQILSIQEISGLLLATTARSKWEDQSLSLSFQEMKRAVSQLSVELVARRAVCSEEIHRILKSATGFDALTALIHELVHGGPSPIAFSVLSKRLESFVEEFVFQA